MKFITLLLLLTINAPFCHGQLAANDLVFSFTSNFTQKIHGDIIDGIEEKVKVLQYRHKLVVINSNGAKTEMPIKFLGNVKMYNYLWYRTYTSPSGTVFISENEKWVNIEGNRNPSIYYSKEQAWGDITNVAQQPNWVMLLNGKPLEEDGMNFHDTDFITIQGRSHQIKDTVPMPGKSGFVSIDPITHAKSLMYPKNQFHVNFSYSGASSGAFNYHQYRDSTQRNFEVQINMPQHTDAYKPQMNYQYQDYISFPHYSSPSLMCNDSTIFIADSVSVTSTPCKYDTARGILFWHDDESYTNNGQNWDTGYVVAMCGAYDIRGEGVTFIPGQCILSYGVIVTERGKKTIQLGTQLDLDEKRFFDNRGRQIKTSSVYGLVIIRK